MNMIWNSLGLAVLGIALLVGAATADDQTGVTGDMPLAYTITSEESMAFGTFTPGSEKTIATDAGTNYDDLGLTTNAAVDLQAYETGATGSEADDGYMHIDATATHLASKLTVKAGTGTAVALGTLGSPAVIKEDATTGTSVITLGQTTSASDAKGTYEITITFAAVAAA